MLLAIVNGIEVAQGSLSNMSRRIRSGDRTGKFVGMILTEGTGYSPGYLIGTILGQAYISVKICSGRKGMMGWNEKMHWKRPQGSLRRIELADNWFNLNPSIMASGVTTAVDHKQNLIADKDRE